LQKTAGGEFKIKNANSDYSSRSVEMTSTFGTARMNAYQIFENLLNQRDCVIRDNKKDEYGRDVLNKFGKPVKVVNFKETQKVQEKARILNEKFVEWLWKNSERRENYVKIYNEKFNNLVGREYDGSRQNLTGMSPLITLRPHQLNAIARAKYGGNSLFAHVVGAGKSFELIATVMEKKRLGLINKAAIVVPKALTTQTAIEWQRLYPNAKLLVATEKDFTKENRNKFMARLTTGSYDGVILSQEQFEKIPVSMERQTAFIRNEIDKIADTMAESDDKMTVKRLEKKKKVLEGKLEKMLTSKKRDTAIEFEQTGIDMIVADESHMYKNGLIVTKMANVSGIGGNAAQKCEDMLMKTQYLNEKFGYKNILFCTGTAISNSMSELYTITQYLRPDLLEKSGIKSFDDWCCNFAKVNTLLEMSPSGGYKPKKRLNEFVNLPELMQIFHTFSDVKNAEDLDLPTPELETGKPITILAQPSEFQLAYIQELAERAEKISTGRVDPRDDNLLKITHEAR
jgi:N12 class adenine-specific DNA methylase